MSSRRCPGIRQRGRTVLTVLHYPGVPPAPHGSSVIIFTTAAIQQCRINSVRYCGPVRTGILRRRPALLKVSIRARKSSPSIYVGLNNLSPLSRARRSRRRRSPLSFEPGRECIAPMELAILCNDSVYTGPSRALRCQKVLWIRSNDRYDCV